MVGDYFVVARRSYGGGVIRSNWVLDLFFRLFGVKTVSSGGRLRFEVIEWSF